MNDRQDNPEIAANQAPANRIGVKHGLNERAPVPNSSLLQARILKATDGLPQQTPRLPLGDRHRQASIKAGFYANLFGLTRPAMGAAALAMLVMVSGSWYLSGTSFNSLPPDNNSEFSTTIGLAGADSNIVSLEKAVSEEAVGGLELDELEWQDMLLMQDEIAFAGL